ncbi:MAG: bifunctional nicotinamide-nucleotide adenylyltransferase/Nudix hydroxylase [Rhodocyclaceae bacterium]
MNGNSMGRPLRDLAVVIGRFQPVHNGHAALLAQALDRAEKVVVVLGSSFHARSPKNPFTWQERAAMLGLCLNDEERRRVSFVPMRDYYNDERWVAAVEKDVAKAAPGARSIALVGHFKDATSNYLNAFPRWELIAVPRTGDVDATAVRRILFEPEAQEVSLAVLSSVVPQAILQYLRAWTKLPGYPPLVDEHAKVAADKAMWKSAPYPPVFVTVDAVVRAAGSVLLVKRANHPGRNLWALPGGFLDQRESLLQAAMRELREETALGIAEPSLAAALKAVAVFDHPHRSLRGRTITHAHFFDLGDARLPEVVGGDDASHAEWIPVDALRAMEDQFFEDHFNILDHFLGLTGA